MASGRTWTEIRNRYSFAQGDGISKVDVRQYGGLGPGASGSPVVGGQNYGGNALGPMAGAFTIKPEIWTYFFSLWVADEQRDPVTIFDRVLIAPSSEGRWDKFRIELNTSTLTVVPRGELVSYARNVVMLRGVNAKELLQRPLR